MSTRRDSLPGLKDVAAHAGVSVATVSRVINGAPYIRDVVRARVLDSMAALGYEPHALAQSLRTGQTQTIGYIVYDISNFLFSAIALGIDDRLQTAGYTTLLTNSRAESRRELELIRLMVRRRVDGLILTLSDETRPELRSALRALQIPIVLLDREVTGVTADEVLTDHALGVAAAVEHLVALGHRRIALVVGTVVIRPNRVVRQTFEASMRRHGLALRPEWLRSEIRSEDAAYTAMAELLALPEPPTALLAGSVQATIGALRYARDRHLQIPEQLSLIGYDDTAAAALSQPALSIVGRDIYAIGWQAGETILGRLENPHAPRRSARVATELLVRGSTAPPPTE
jgi:LacI family transcriptional regulator